MTSIVDASGSKTATVAGTCTFTNGSAVIAMTNTAAAGDRVVFSNAGGALPTNFVAGTNYYVISTGLSGSQFEVSATSGGSAISAGSAGTGTQTATIEHVLDSPTTNAIYIFSVDTINLTTSDLIELRCYDMIDGSNYRQIWKGVFQNAQVNPGKNAPPMPIITQGQFTIKQLAGTGRAFPWRVTRI